MPIEIDLPPSPQDDAVLNSNEVSQLLGLSKFTLLRMRQRPDLGGLPYIKLSEGRLGYQRRDVRAFLAARRVSGEGSEAA
jgi:predicted DNA-binding transcriptional regulator AlpA